LNVDLRTSKIKVNPSNELVKELNQMGNIMVEIV
jgi:hypothetical protein